MIQKSLFHFSHYSAKNISFFSNGVGKFVAATSSMLGLFLNQNKYYRPEDGFPASVTNP
jgi:hypothetical protein